MFCGYGIRNCFCICKGLYYKGKECDGLKDEIEFCNVFFCLGRYIWLIEKVFEDKIDKEMMMYGL